MEKLKPIIPSIPKVLLSSERCQDCCLEVLESSGLTWLIAKLFQHNIIAHGVGEDFGIWAIVISRCRSHLAVLPPSSGSLQANDYG